MRRTFHPILFAAFPLLFLYGENKWRMSAGELVLPLVATVGAIAILQVALSRLTHAPRKVAIALSALALLFLTYGHIWGVVGDEEGRVFGIDADFIVGPVYVLILALVVRFAVRTKRPLVDATRILNFFAIGLLVTALLPTASGLIRGGPAIASTETPPLDINNPAVPGEKQPDIYHLVFDRYAGVGTLDRLFHYDNADFFGYLEERGFDVATEARANYTNTHLSLAASLNVNYLDWLSRAHIDSSQQRPATNAIEHHGVAQFLRARGYRYVHVGSRWDMTRQSPHADVNIRLDPTSEFSRTYLGSTGLLPLMRRDIAGPAETDAEDTARTVSLRQFDAVTNTRHDERPTYVFAHFALPHPPYAFNRYGRPIDEQPEGWKPKSKAYLEQLKFTNTKIQETVDALLDTPESERPIVIVTADEGPYPSFGSGSPPQWWTIPDEKLRTKFRILNAVYLPGADIEPLPETFSPVNNFRLIFNTYFGTDLPLLPDESYVSFSKSDLYNFVRITDRVAEPFRLPPFLAPSTYSVRALKAWSFAQR